MRLAMGLGVLAGAVSPVFAAGMQASPHAWHEHAHHKKHNPNVLWHLISKCRASALRVGYPPHPCVEVDDPMHPAEGYGVLKDLAGRYQYLVMPLARITGIESPLLLAPAAPNYFADAWPARLYVEAALHHRVPRDQLALVVNSIDGRSQNQLHIHVDCIKPSVHQALLDMRASLTTQWQPLPRPLPPNGHHYVARWVDGATLSVNPFKSLAASLPAGDRMALHSLIAVGAYAADGKPGFILLSGRVNKRTGDVGSGDELHDLSCAIATSHGH
ncbi:CDP-diacylglycerol diphosphatase [Dyella sp. A6]|uniref:CDP-diacylglycerol diphosphatase n=1 Tax=Dyella aluminiiresistens TaxID=3069105 RepID=UPI002E775D02|nr:CDP-diacylglycerol diphosphatase [Dyella sp. A6]